MRKAQRAVREAGSVLRKARIRRAPVDVYKLARAYAEVIEKPMPDAISGMLIPAAHAARAKSYVIVVNAKHPPSRRRFTVAHELGHLLLHGFKTPHADTGFKIRFRANTAYDGSVAEEIEANQFAAEILMPTDILLQRIADIDLEYAPFAASDADPLDQLARDFQVSKQALQIRLTEFI